MVLGISCTNKKCEYYFEDSCTKVYETNKMRISKNGTCEDFEYGINIRYRDSPWYEKEFAEINEIKRQVAEIVHDL